MRRCAATPRRVLVDIRPAFPCGELLAVTDATFVLFANQRVTIAPRSIVERIAFGWERARDRRGRDFR